MQAYQAGVAALRLSLKDVTVERAENLVDQIQEVAAYFETTFEFYFLFYYLNRNLSWSLVYKTNVW